MPSPLAAAAETESVDESSEAARKSSRQRTPRLLAADRTAPVTAHRFATARYADRIHVIDKGDVVAEQGIHDELLARHGLPAPLRRFPADAPAA
ncbi:hypothetical protein ACFC00_06685 [Streptomyces adustus]|uniref:hypothetical protein n=1 Tax=Streptomyces adustus TaxID=1609272 RepID=UPI0035D75C8A